jgi:hypothetical protein
MYKDALETPVVVARPVQVTVPLPGIVRCRSQTSECREPVRTGEAREVVADRGEELGTQQRTDAGHAGHDLGELVRPEPCLDEPVGLGDLLVEGLDLLGERPNELSDHSFAGNGGVLPLCGLHNLLRELVWTADAARAQPSGEPPGPEAPDGCRHLVAGQQDERSGTGQDERAFQRREHAGQGGAQPVDGPGAVADEVGAAVRQEPELDDGLVTGPQFLEVPADPSLVGDDERVACVGLALAPVAVAGPVDHPAWNVEDLLPVVDE